MLYATLVLVEGGDEAAQYSERFRVVAAKKMHVTGTYGRVLLSRVNATVNGARKVSVDVDSFKRKMKSVQGRALDGFCPQLSTKYVQQALLLPSYQTWLYHT
jgi:hypothetical protein